MMYKWKQGVSCMLAFIGKLDPPAQNQGGQEEALSMNGKNGGKKKKKEKIYIYFLDILECISELFLVVGLLHQ